MSHRNWVLETLIPHHSLTFKAYVDLLQGQKWHPVHTGGLWCSFYFLIRFPWWLSSKEPTCNAEDAGDMGSIPGSGRSPGGGHGNLLQYSCLESSMDRGACWATVHGVAKSRTWLKWLSTHAGQHDADPDAHHTGYTGWQVRPVHRPQVTSVFSCWKGGDPPLARTPHLSESAPKSKLTVAECPDLGSAWTWNQIYIHCWPA